LVSQKSERSSLTALRGRAGSSERFFWYAPIMGSLKVCSICSRPGGREAVDPMLARKIPMNNSLSQLTVQERGALIGYLQSHVPLKDFDQAA